MTSLGIGDARAGPWGCWLGLRVPPVLPSPRLVLVPAGSVAQLHAHRAGSGGSAVGHCCCQRPADQEIRLRGQVRGHPVPPTHLGIAQSHPCTPLPPTHLGAAHIAQCYLPNSVPLAHLALPSRPSATHTPSVTLTRHCRLYPGATPAPRCQPRPLAAARCHGRPCPVPWQCCARCHGSAVPAGSWFTATRCCASTRRPTAWRGWRGWAVPAWPPREATMMTPMR